MGLDNIACKARQHQVLKKWQDVSSEGKKEWAERSQAYNKDKENNGFTIKKLAPKHASHVVRPVVHFLRHKFAEMTTKEAHKIWRDMSPAERTAFAEDTKEDRKVDM